MGETAGKTQGADFSSPERHKIRSAVPQNALLDIKKPACTLFLETPMLSLFLPHRILVRASVLQRLIQAVSPAERP